MIVPFLKVKSQYDNSELNSWKKEYKRNAHFHDQKPNGFPKGFDYWVTERKLF